MISFARKTSTRRRVLAAGLVCGLAGVLVPAGTEAETNAAYGANPARAISVPASAPAAWSLSDYLSQTPTWSLTTCSSLTKQVVAQIGGPVTECARVRSPLNWSNLSQGSITLQVTRTRRTVEAGDSRPSRVLFVNPGGPGVAAGDIAPYVAYLEPEVAKLDDVVAVDPRGTGLSTPLACTLYPDGVTDYRVVTASTIAAQQKAAARTVAACVAKAPTYLPQINTANTIRDHDLVRALLGADTIDFLGFSAGTWLGANYAQQFPSRVGRFVLDSNTEFTSDWRTSFGWQPKSFQRRFEAQFLPWVARHNADFGLGTRTATVRASYEKIRAAAGKRLLTGENPNTIDDAIIGAMYSDQDFVSLAIQMSDWYHAAITSTRRTTAPIFVARPSAEDTVFMAIQCNDRAWSSVPSAYVADGKAKGASYPLLGYSFVSQPCAYWPHYTRAALAKPTGAGVPEMLMVQTELDPATAWEGASLAERGNSATRLLTVANQGNHTAYLGDNSCVENAVTPFLTTGILPPAGMVCAGIPLPAENRVYSVSTRTRTRAPSRSTVWAPVQTRVARSLRAALVDKIAAVATAG